MKVKLARNEVTSRVITHAPIVHKQSRIEFCMQYAEAEIERSITNCWSQVLHLCSLIALIVAFF